MTLHGTHGDVIWHNGETDGYHSFIGFTADHRHGVLVLTNTSLSVDDLGFATLRPDAKLAATHKSIPIAATAEDEYVGSYQRKMRNMLQIFRTGDQLYAQGSGQDPFPIYASARDEFFARVADVGFSFQRDGSHSIKALVLHQDGDTVLPRLSDKDAAAAAAKHDAQANAASGQPAVALDAVTLAGYVGHYQLAPDTSFTITLTDSQMLVQLTGQDALPVYASAKDKFFLKVVDAEIDFKRDDDGHVVALVLHQGGTDQRAKRTGN